MKELFVYYARCNAEIDSRMLTLLEERVDEPMKTPLSGYFFKTLGELLEHIYVANANWMSAFVGLADHGIDLTEVIGPLPKYGERVFGSFAEYTAAQRRLDELIVRYCEALTDEDLNAVLSRKRRNGETTSKVVWKALLHFFNHQTHHRGQVSCILDELKIQNDYSNMIFIE